MACLLALLLFISICSAQDRLYIVQYGDESLAQITLSDGSVNSHVLDLGYGCNDIIVNDTKLFVVNSLLNTVQEIDATTNSTIRIIPTTGGMNPYSAALINPDTLAVTNWLSNNVLLIRLSDGMTVANIPVGIAPQGIVANHDKVYVCLTRYLSFGHYGPGVVLIYDHETFTLRDSIQVGMNPQCTVVDIAERLHVVCTGDYGSTEGSVHVVDLTTRETVAVLPVGGTPSAISLGGGSAYLAAGGWGNAGFVEKYRLDDLEIINDSQNPITTASGATDVEAMPDGSFYVSCATEDLVNLHQADGSLVRSFPVSDGPGPMVVYREPNSVVFQPERFYPSHVEISQVYPNPFNNVVRIGLNVSLPVESKIKIYNILGAMVDELTIPAGRSFVQWNPRSNHVNQLSSGVYLARLEDGGGGKTMKIVYIR